jgi:hypothetical protein
MIFYLVRDKMKQLLIILLSLSLICLIGVLYLESKGLSEGFQVVVQEPLTTSFDGGGISYFPKIVTTEATEPEGEEILQNFNKCITSGNDTVKGCLTSSGAGFKVGVCINICKQQYGELSSYCSSVCADQQNQVNTSARFGPA